jgi:Protein of unknown function (DUF2946)
MDDIVKAALKKWPNVPACYDWLALDARGDWYMRDDRIQASGPFPQVKGSRILHDKLKEFIHRNYEADEQGAWFFQNGPQRVYVWLEAAPWVVGVQMDDTAPGGFRLETHTGLPVTDVKACFLDEHGRVFLSFERGLGVVRSMDMLAAAEAIEALGWAPQEVSFDTLPLAHGHVLRPQAPVPSVQA